MRLSWLHPDAAVQMLQARAYMDIDSGSGYDRRMKGWAFTFVLVGAGAFSGCASAPMLPTELDEHSWIVDVLRAPSLSSANASDGYSQRIRLTVAPPYIAGHRISVRLDQSEAGSTIGLYTYGSNGPSRWVATKRRQFDVSASEMERLAQLMRDAGIWETYQFESRMGEVCFDGTYVALERASASGYQFSVSNVQCGASLEYVEVIRYIATLAGVGEKVENWLW